MNVFPLVGWMQKKVAGGHGVSRQFFLLRNAMLNDNEAELVYLTLLKSKFQDIFEYLWRALVDKKNRYCVCAFEIFNFHESMPLPVCVNFSIFVHASTFRSFHWKYRPLIRYISPISNHHKQAADRSLHSHSTSVTNELLITFLSSQQFSVRETYFQFQTVYCVHHMKSSRAPVEIIRLRK